MDSVASVPYLDSFAVVGGSAASNLVDVVYLYDVAGRRWVALPNRLDQRKRQTIARPTKMGYCSSKDPSIPY